MKHEIWKGFFLHQVNCPLAADEENCFTLTTSTTPRQAGKLICILNFFSQPPPYFSIFILNLFSSLIYEVPCQTRKPQGTTVWGLSNEMIAHLTSMVNKRSPV